MIDYLLSLLQFVALVGFLGFAWVLAGRAISWEVRRRDRRRK